MQNLKKISLQLDFRQWLSGHKSDIINVLTIVMIWLVMSVLANPFGDFPLNDDWVYALSVKSVLETGYFQFPSGTSSNVGPQVYWGYLFCLPFGFSFTALRVSTLTLGLGGVITLYALVRELGGERRTALLGALALAVNPLYFALANSFMTDVPFISLVMIALYFLVRGLRHHSSVDLVLGFFISFAAILVRQFGLVVLLAFAFAYLIKNGAGLVNLAKASAPLALGTILHFTYQHWLIETGRMPMLSEHSSIQQLLPASLTVWAVLTGKRLITIPMYIGFFALPFLCGFIPRKSIGFMSERSKSIRVILIAFALLSLGGIWWTGKIMPLMVNVLIKSGIGPLTLHDTFVLGINEPAIPLAIAAFWVVLTLLAMAAACSVIYYVALASHRAIVEFLNPESRPITWSYTFFTVMGAAYLAVLMVLFIKVTLYDRYLLLFFPLFILLVSAVTLESQPPLHRTRVGLSFVLLVLYAGFSVAATHDYLSWNRSRWIALHSLIDDGKVHPNQINGGYEFGWVLYDSKHVKKLGKVDNDEYMVTFGPVPGYTELRRYPFQRWLFFSESDIFILRRTFING